MIELDGSHMEGGGAILRQALALSAITGKPFKINDIRKGRPDPGLKHQHLYCVKALEQICNATVRNERIGAESIEFFPSEIKARTLKVDVKTAGSLTLLMQSLLIPCIFSKKPFRFELIGGTDVEWSQHADYFTHILLPQLRKYTDMDVRLLRRGYYPKGQGKMEVTIKGRYNLQDELPGIDLIEKGRLLLIKGISHASYDLEKAQVSDRQKRAARQLFSKYDVPINITSEYNKTLSTGSGITLWARYESPDENPVILAGNCLGRRGRSSEEVGRIAANNLLREMNSEACCDRYLADQLIPFMAMAPGSKIITSEITDHTHSNIYVAEKFLDVKFRIEGNRISSQRGL